MKILDSKTVLNKKKVSQNDDIFKSLKSKNLLEKEVLGLMAYKDSVEPEKIKEVEAFFKFMREMQVKKAYIINEINDLKAERKELMQPFIEQEIESKEAGTSIKKKLINEKIDKLEKLDKEMTVKRLELADKERKIKNERLDLEKREQALETKIKSFNKFIKNYDTNN